MTIPPPCSASLPCVFRSRNLADTPVRRRHFHRLLRFVPLHPCRRVPVRFAHGWIKISRRFVKPPTGRPSTLERLSARPSSKPRSNGSRRWFAFASNNSLGARPRPLRRRLLRPRTHPALIRRHGGRAASNLVGKVRSDAITPTFWLSTTLKSFHRRSAVARGVVSRLPTSLAPRIP